jgi:hypothetical protein
VIDSGDGVTHVIPVVTEIIINNLFLFGRFLIVVLIFVG